MVEDGTGKEAGLSDRDNAGKTGTTDEPQGRLVRRLHPEPGRRGLGRRRRAKQVKMNDITIGGQYYDKVFGGRSRPDLAGRDDRRPGRQGARAFNTSTSRPNRATKPARQDDGKGHGDNADRGNEPGDNGGNRRHRPADVPVPPGIIRRRRRRQDRAALANRNGGNGGQPERSRSASLTRPVTGAAAQDVDDG